MSVDPIVGVVELLSGNDGLLELQMLLGYVFFDDGTADTSEGTKGTLLLPVPDEGTLRDGAGSSTKPGRWWGLPLPMVLLKMFSAICLINYEAK